jgi:beta-glucosidase
VTAHRAKKRRLNARESQAMPQDAATTAEAFKDPGAPIEARVADLLRQLTLEEKVSLLAGSAAFAMEPLPRLGVPALRMTDGPTGVRSNTGAAATVFPVAVALAATWNPAVAHDIAAAIGREAKAMGERIILAPTINIVRTPLWGRNFETFSEDPYLTAQLAIAYVEGLQGEGVGASLKHYAVNNQEHRRMDVSAEVDERTLREIYLHAFETVIKAVNPWTVMASYNKVNGTYASENPYLLTDILKGEWRYDGVAVSDWGAVHSTAPAVNAGLDLEMPGPPRHFGARLLAAVQDGQVPKATIDEAARRLIRLMLRTGHLDGVPASGGELCSDRHRTIARRAAEESFVLLKNDGGLLPLASEATRSLALIGPNAGRLRIQGDGSSRVHSPHRPTPLDSFRARLGEAVQVTFAEGCDNEPVPPQAEAQMFSPTAAAPTEERAGHGLRLQFFDNPDFQGEPVRSNVDRRLARWISAFSPDPSQTPHIALRWSGSVWPLRDGVHEFSIRGDGDARLTLDGEAIIVPQTPGAEDAQDITGGPAMRRTAAVTLQAGRGYAITIDYVWAKARPGAGFEAFGLGLRQPTGSIAEAVAAARAADVAVVIVGSASITEAEGYDREDIDLPGRQNPLVEAVLAANPNTIVVINSGAPMAMPWIDKARAVVQAWLPGEEGPDALVGLLFGDSAPSGRLPVSFPRRLRDNPAHPFYPGGDKADYGEGLFVGYRHYDRAGLETLFPFGHGLTYTDFAYADLKVPATAAVGEPVQVSLTLTNTGARAGQETAQLYIQPKSPSQPRPIKELKGFAKVELAPGGAKTVTLNLTERDFSFYDANQKRWIAEAGEYAVLIGASATDIRLRGTLRLG